MKCRSFLWLIGVLTLSLRIAAFGQSSLQISAIGTPQLWQGGEFRVQNVPASTNTFDPDTIAVDASFTLPSGTNLVVPAFWYQGYTRNLSSGNETLAAAGAPEWRVRFTAPESGSYSVTVTVRTNRQFFGSSAPYAFTVVSNVAIARSGYVRKNAANQYFETGDGQALRLIGENVCWPGSAGTYDYDNYFPRMQAVGENFARLWMCPWAFGLETDTNSLTQYRLDRAWQLDYVFRLAEQRGIYLLLCLDYHGMFETQPDYWGGNNYWPVNPYNVARGGPCLNQNGFFTNSSAKLIYQKRLRYLVARYGYSQSLLAWEFFNEIDNVYSYLNPNDVAAWHNLMGGWIHTNDPFHHLVTTSLTGSSDRPELWVQPNLDFAAYHSYGETSPSARLSAVAQSFLSRYGKPVMVGEFGTDWRGWNLQNDPYLRGFRQGIWGGALSGSVGTAMSWWWENIQAENLYPIYNALGTVLNHTGWGRGAWTNIDFQTSGAPPVNLGNPITNGQAFSAFLPLSSVWGDKPSGQLAVANPSSADYSATSLNAFVQGTGHPDLRVPFRLNAWFTNNARLVMHLNSVSDGAIMVVRSDSTELFRTNLPNLDGTWNVNNEYNVDIQVSVPTGQHSLSISNAGVDWFYLDWVKLEGVMPADYSPRWVASPLSIGLRGRSEALVYVVAPGASFPAGATNSSLPLQQNQSIVLKNWPLGVFYGEWLDPRTGTNIIRVQSSTTNGVLSLALPDFLEDLAGVIYPAPTLSSPGVDSGGVFGFQLDSETGGQYQIQSSTDLMHWAVLSVVTNTPGVLRVRTWPPNTTSQGFFRAVK